MLGFRREQRRGRIAGLSKQGLQTTIVKMDLVHLALTLEPAHESRHRPMKSLTLGGIADPMNQQDA
jgi:hypothetical protein